jgi:hypothetical protein
VAESEEDGKGKKTEEGTGKVGGRGGRAVRWWGGRRECVEAERVVRARESKTLRRSEESEWGKKAGGAGGGRGDGDDDEG